MNPKCKKQNKKASKKKRNSVPGMDESFHKEVFSKNGNQDA